VTEVQNSLRRRWNIGRRGTSTRGMRPVPDSRQSAPCELRSARVAAASVIINHDAVFAAPAILCTRRGCQVRIATAISCLRISSRPLDMCIASLQKPRYRRITVDNKLALPVHARRGVVEPGATHHVAKSGRPPPSVKILTSTASPRGFMEGRGNKRHTQPYFSFRRVTALITWSTSSSSSVGTADAQRSS